MSVFLVRAFVRLREMALADEKLAHRVDQLERRVSDHDEILIELVREIRRLIETPEPKGKKSKIGFIMSGDLNPKA